MDGDEADAAAKGASVGMTRDGASLILSVDANMTEVLGWRPSQLLGRPSTEFIHPEDQGSAVSAWWEMIDSPGQARRWVGRYRDSTGKWVWVECLNVNELDQATNPVVSTTMRRVTVGHVSLAEELRAQGELLKRLSDAMPVGVFQIDLHRAVTFTNDRLHAILGWPAEAMADAQFSTVTTEDRVLLEAAFDGVLDDRSVDDLELRFLPPSASGDERVCVLSMRPLTDGAGQVAGAVGCVTDVTDQVQLRRQLELRATTDTLTGCLNREAILEALSDVVGRRDTATGTAVVFVDLCRFKTVNDRFGHAAGDRLLKRAGECLRSAIGAGDLAGRFGGDEFLVVCSGVATASDAVEAGRRVGRALSGRVDLPSGAVELGASVGVAWTDEKLDADTLVAQADQAMYEAKRTGSALAVFSGSGPPVVFEAADLATG
ncbi:MAG TPA: diguanylate cyclase [Acidimicrobiales bacterium]